MLKILFSGVGLLQFWGTLALVVHCCRHSWRFMGVSDIAEMQRPFFSVKMTEHLSGCICMPVKLARWSLQRTATQNSPRQGLRSYESTSYDVMTTEFDSKFYKL